MPYVARALCGALILSLAALVVRPAAAEGEVNVYTTREPGLALPLFERFTEATGIAVNTIFVEQGLAERLAIEGTNSPADVLMVVDFGILADLVDRGLTQPVESEVLTSTIPAVLRDPDNQWFALSMRARVIYASKDRVTQQSMTYEDLASDEWRGRVCIRSGQHPYNTSLFAALIAKDGDEAAEDYLVALKNNLARRPGGGDRDVARDILAGICDIGVGNSYYVGLMRSGTGGAEQVEWGNAIRVILPTFADHVGTHVNISGAAVARHAPHPENAKKLLEFLVSDEAQKLYADANFEYPVKPGVAVHPIIAELGELTIDDLPLVEIAAHRKDASLLVDEVGFDN